MGNIKEDLEKVKEFVENEKLAREEKDKKKFRYPFGKKVGKSQKKKNYVTVLKIYENGNASFDKVQIKDQTFWIEGLPRLAASGYVLQERKNPLIILPMWSVEPFSAMEHFVDSLTNGTNAKGYKLLLANMENEAIKQKPQMSGIIKWVIGIGFVAIIVYAFVSGAV